MVTLARPPTRYSSKLTNRSFRYAAPCLWNELPTDLREPRQTVSCTFSYHTWQFIIFTIFTITAYIFSYSSGLISIPLWVRLGTGYELTWVRVVLGTSWCWIRVDLGTSWQSTSCLGYELTGKPTANLNIIIITSHEVDGSRPEASRASVSEK